jgi:hypothetical protein
MRNNVASAVKMAKRCNQELLWDPGTIQKRSRPGKNRLKHRLYPTRKKITTAKKAQQQLCDIFHNLALHRKNRLPNKLKKNRQKRNKKHLFK